MEVGEKDLGQGEAHAVAHHLALRSLAALEQQRLAAARNHQGGNAALDRRPRGGGAEEEDFEQARRSAPGRSVRDGP